MDIEKEREAFEQHLTDTGLVEFAGYGFAVDECDEYLHEPTQVAWDSWLIGLNRTKAQAVPETQQALNDRLLVKSIREHVESHIADISVNDLFDKGWLAAMKCIRNNIDMLEHRRQHNIFEESDKIVFVDDFMHDELMVVAWTRKGEVWMDEGEKRCTDLSMIRHATPEEIKAGKRLEPAND